MPNPRGNKKNLPTQLPSRLWWLLSKLVGIKTCNNDRPVLATLLYCVTLASSLTYGVTYIFYLYYDAESSDTYRTYPSSMLDFAVVIFYCALGTYGMSLISKIMTTKLLCDGVRLHSRTVFRINSQLMVAVIVATIALLGYTINTDTRSAHRFRLIQLPHFLLYILNYSKIIYSGMLCFWNYICAWFLLSICRSHTITVRRMNSDLEFEGKVREFLYLLNSSRKTIEKAVPDSLNGENDAHGVGFGSDRKTRAGSSPSASLDHNGACLVQEPFFGSINADCSESISSQLKRFSVSQDDTTGNDAMSKFEAAADKPRNSLPLTDPNPQHLEKYLLEDEDLFARYWNLNQKLKATSIVFQRWLSSWVAFAVMWVFNYLIQWVGTTKSISLQYVAAVLLPLLLLVIVCSSYAEVNNECRLVPTCIYPSQQKAVFLSSLAHFPLQLTVFSTTLSYQTIYAIIVTIGMALSTKIILDKLS